ncbi:MAG: T9SS type A sorting domain-containing protein [Bacteroidetes bacterium]|nr:T9SS type A sorting domain-containing protein [Bacteroidota bacterium]
MRKQQYKVNQNAISILRSYGTEWLLFMAMLMSSIGASAQSFNEVIKAVASDRAIDDLFGWSVSIDGNYAIAGAWQEDEDTSGANTLSDPGSAYVFERDGNGNWNQVQKLVASDRSSFVWFGVSVSISGTYAIVGAYKESKDTAGPNIVQAGAAYVFERDGNGNWNEVQKLVAPDRDVADHFGYAVSVDGNYAIVGAYQEDEDTSGSNTLLQAGSAYMFERDINGNWNQVQKIVASDRGNDDVFGIAVSLSGSYAIVGAYRENEDTSGGNTKFDAGSAYLFERDGNGNWNEVQKIVAADRASSAYFGATVSMSVDYAIVGAYWESKDTLGGNPVSRAGAAYVFERDSNGNWNQAQKLIASDRAPSDYFGSSVTISNNFAIVGAYWEDEDISGSNTMLLAGSAYVYERNGNGDWNEIQKIVPSDRGAGDRFGWAVSISGDYAFIGAFYEDENLVGGNTLSNAGSVYIFRYCANTALTINQTACDLFISPSGNYTWTSSGNYMDTIANTVGCDSILTFNLTINQSSSGSITETACDSYTSPSGNYTWTSSGNYMDTILNVEGCDSVIAINLTISNATSSSITEDVCNTYTSPSTKYTWTASGTYLDTILNTAGCDSVIAINLTIRISTSSSITESACDMYTSPSGNYNWTVSGNYMDTIPNIAGCDSLISIMLMISNSSSSSISDTACITYTSPSGNYIWTSSGSYNDTIPNAENCDSLISISLEVNTVDTSITKAGGILTANALGANYQWIDCGNGSIAITGETNQSFTTNVNGSFAVVVTENDCMDTSKCYNITIIGISEINHDLQFHIYPNPNDGLFTIELTPTLKSLHLEVFNSLGQLIRSIPMTHKGNQVQLVEKGIYLLRSFDDKTTLQELVIVR